MDRLPTDIERMRRHYDASPLPAPSPSASFADDDNALYENNLLTCFYLRDRERVQVSGRAILDVGCGTGVTTLALAQANPGARVVGVDLSEVSIGLARERLAHQGFSDVEFLCAGIEELPTRLGSERFDYVNAREVLYLLPDPAAALAKMRSLLKPGGILRTDLHDRHQRSAFYRAQEICRRLAIAGEAGVPLVEQMMESLKEGVDLRRHAWEESRKLADRRDWVMANYLIVGDRGFTVPELFELLDQSGLHFLRMVHWPTWELSALFEDGQDSPLPLALEQVLAHGTPREQLTLFELFHPEHRLIDFWASPSAPRSWPEIDPRRSRLHLHPQLGTARTREYLCACIDRQQTFSLNFYLRSPFDEAIVLDPRVAAALLPLWEGPVPFADFARHWSELTGLDPDGALANIEAFVLCLESYAYLMLEAE